MMRNLTVLKVAAAGALLLAGTVPAGASAPADFTEVAEQAPGVPEGFSPAATNWVSPDEGWVLGYVPCEDDSCAAVLHTRTGGESWAALQAPDLHPSEFNNNSQLAVVQTPRMTTLIASNTEDTVISRTGGESWHPVDLPADKVGDLAAGPDGIYLSAHTVDGDEASMTLWHSPATWPTWDQVPGVAADVPAQLASVLSDIAAGPQGVRLVGTSAFGAPTQAWALPDGEPPEQIEAPCGEYATQFFGVADDEHEFALCSQNPGRGSMDKQLFAATNGVTFEPVGTLPPQAGITSDFAVADANTVAIGATGGGVGMLHMSFDGGQTWQTTLQSQDTGPVFDVDFQDAEHGVLMTGYLGTSVIYRTVDGGHTWEPLDL